MKTEGKVIFVGEAIQASPKFRKRDLILEIAENPQYPQEVMFQAAQDRCALLDNIHPGMIVEVDFNLRGRRWNAPGGEVKWFNTLEAWRITPKAGTYTPDAKQERYTGAAQVATVIKETDNEDDLPF